MRIGMILDNEINDDIRVQNEVNVLINQGHQIYLFCKGKKGLEAFENRKNLFVRRFFINKKIYGALTILIQVSALFNSFWFYKSFRFFKQYKIEVIHVHDMYMYYPAKKLSQKLGVPLILDLHENYPETVKTYSWTRKWYVRLFYDVAKWERIENMVLTNADRLVVLSDEFKEELLSRHTSLEYSKIFRYSNVPDISFFKSLKVDSQIFSKNHPESLLIFYFGVIAKRRGIDILIKAVLKLIGENKNVELLLIGPIDSAEEKEFKMLMNKLVEEQRMTHFAWKDIRLLPSYIFLSDVCISPLIKNNQHESGVANKIFQYMYFKKPSIVSNCKPQAEVIEQNSCGLVFESGNVIDLASKINDFIENPSLIDKYGKNGYEAIELKYNSDIEGENLHALYESL